MNRISVDSNNRPDLSARAILTLIGGVAAAAILIALWQESPAPGSTAGQLCAAIGALLLLAPLAFSLMKRSGLAASPPTWFVAHVLATSAGLCLIFIHVAAGDWISPPGLVLLFLVFLVAQGSLLRVVISNRFSLLFARSAVARGFSAPASSDKQAIQALIDAKTELLIGLDSTASESQFSPALRHWLRHPLLSFRYQRLAAREAALVGARAAAGATLAWSRRIHMFVAVAFYLGLIAHVVVMLFFAGYAAGDGPIDWWYITDWGR